jgi:hypothetical protein
MPVAPVSQRMLASDLCQALVFSARSACPARRRPCAGDEERLHDCRQAFEL